MLVPHRKITAKERTNKTKKAWTSCTRGALSAGAQARTRLQLIGAVAGAIIASLSPNSTSLPRPEDNLSSNPQASAKWGQTSIDRHIEVRRLIPQRPTLPRGTAVRGGASIRVPQLERFGARLLSADVVLWESTRVDRFQYRLRRHKVTVYVYDCERIVLRTLASLRPRVVRDEVIFLGEKRGYSLAVIEKGGLGYAVVSDASPDECVELAAAMLSE